MTGRSEDKVQYNDGNGRIRGFGQDGRFTDRSVDGRVRTAKRIFFLAIIDRRMFPALFSEGKLPLWA